MDSKYNPHGCGWSIWHTGTPICRLQTVPCALLRGEKCYMQESDEAVEAIGKIINGEGEEKDS